MRARTKGQERLPPQSEHQETTVAKGQKKSNKEIRKPKAEKPKPAVSVSASFLNPAAKKK